MQVLIMKVYSDEAGNIGNVSYVKNEAVFIFIFHSSLQ
jgi:hypothetical protein